MSRTVQDRQCGAHRINDAMEGRGSTLKFVNIPDMLSGAFLNDISGLDSNICHPLKGAVYYSKNTGPDTFDVIIFQNDLAEDVAAAYAKWFMGHLYIAYADEESREKIETAKAVPA